MFSIGGIWFQVDKDFKKKTHSTPYNTEDKAYLCFNLESTSVLENQANFPKADFVSICTFLCTTYIDTYKHTLRVRIIKRKVWNLKKKSPLFFAFKKPREPQTQTSDYYKISPQKMKTRWIDALFKKHFDQLKIFAWEAFISFTRVVFL